MWLDGSRFLTVCGSEVGLKCWSHCAISSNVLWRWQYCRSESQNQGESKRGITSINGRGSACIEEGAWCQPYTYFVDDCPQVHASAQRLLSSKHLKDQ